MRTKAKGVATFAALALAASAPGTGPSRVIRGNENIGTFDVQHDEGKLRYAIAAFGRPSTLRPRSDSGCAAEWRRLGLFMGFTVGLKKPWCSRNERFEFAIVTGRAWRTARELRIGDSRERLRELYPRARPRYGLDRWVYALLVVPGFQGTEVALGAVITGGKVSAFEVQP